MTIVPLAIRSPAARVPSIDESVRALAQQQASVPDVEWHIMAGRVAATARRSKIWNARRLFFFAFPTLSGSTLYCDLKDPEHGYSLAGADATYDHAAFSGIRLVGDTVIDTEFVFSDAYWWLMLKHLNSDEAEFRGNGGMGARSAIDGVVSQFGFYPCNTIRRLGVWAGPNVQKTFDTENALGTSGVGARGAEAVRAYVGGAARDAVMTRSGELPTLPVMVGSIGGTAPRLHQTIAYAAIFEDEAEIPTTAEIEAFEAAIFDFHDFYQVRGEAEGSDAPVGDGWFSPNARDHMNPLRRKVYNQGPEPAYDGQSNISAEQQPGYPDYPLTDCDRTGYGSAQTGVTVHLRHRFFRSDPGGALRLKPNQFDRSPVIGGRTTGFEITTRRKAQLGTIACILIIDGVSYADALSYLNTHGWANDGTWDTATSILVTPAYAAAHAVTLFTEDRQAGTWKVMVDKFVVSDQRFADRPAGMAKRLRFDAEMHDGTTGEELYDACVEMDGLFTPRGIKFSLGVNALQQSTTSGVDPAWWYRINALEVICYHQIYAKPNPPGGLHRAHLDAELAICKGADGLQDPQIDKLLVSWGKGTLANLKAVGVAYGHAINQFVVDNDSGGYRMTLGRGKRGGGPERYENQITFAALGIVPPVFADGSPNPAFVEWDDDPPLPTTDERRYDCRNGDLPPGIVYTRAGAMPGVDPVSLLLTSFPTDQPVFDVESLTGEIRGLTGKAAMTNIWHKSSQLDNAYWLPNARADVIDVDGSAAADGSMSADKIAVGTTDLGTHNITTASNTSFTAGQRYVAAAVFEAAELEHGYISFSSAVFGGGTSTRAVIKLTDGSILMVMGTPDYGFIRLSATHWLFWISAVAANTTTGSTNIGLGTTDGIISFVGSVGDGVFASGLTLIAGSAVPLPIPTDGSSVTVGAVVANLSSGYAQTDKAMYFDFLAPPIAQHGVAWQIDDGTQNNRWSLELLANGEVHCYRVVSGVTTSDLLLGTVAPGDRVRGVVKRGAAGFAGQLEGEALVTSGAASDSGTLTHGRLFRDATGANYWNDTMAVLEHAETADTADFAAIIANRGFLPS